ncbi:helix-turn-helix transcriptional regulator [Tepidibacter hydrothermalis]|uniref:Helix-turn-helix domain-containing protein n=1 Tax=Tepidibacter hydrothermalis TaxID=3036126 RepID=A0ABY8EA09_9FIRM|nr:helix-turn-helix domain-containing protein [Tepidibacter hydrothermalis]WFD09773.1 helix-turn-helix domain-containing protein [Tepidibacter hydrothermalis]
MRKNLKNEREKLGLTQAQLAKILGVARTTYTNIELGLKNPSFSLALKIKKELKAKDDNIFLKTNVPKRNKNRRLA